MDFLLTANLTYLIFFDVILIVFQVSKTHFTINHKIVKNPMAGLHFYGFYLQFNPDCGIRSRGVVKNFTKGGQNATWCLNVGGSKPQIFSSFKVSSKILGGSIDPLDPPLTRPLALYEKVSKLISVALGL